MTMLDRMRRHKNWLKWSLALVVLTFVIFYIPDFLNRNGTSSPVAAPAKEVVADVDGHTVTAGEFQRRYQAQIQAYQSSYGDQMNIQLLKQLGIDRQILQQLIDERAALAEATRRGIKVSDEELAQQIFAIPAFQQNGRFAGEAQYEAVLRSQRPPLTKAEFEQNLRDGLMVERLRTAVTDWLSIPDAEIEKAFRLRNEKVKLQVVSVPMASFAAKVTVTDADISARYESHKEEYRTGERRKVRFLLLDLEQTRSRTTVPVADIERFYNENINLYSTPEQVHARHILLKTEGKDEAVVRTQAEEVLKQVKAGGDFAALAKKYSEDDGSKANGGDLDYFGKGRMVPEFEAAAFAMSVGQTSELVKSSFGFHIIRVEDKKAGTTRTLDDARAEIADQLKFRAAQAAIASQARTLEARLKTPADLDKVAKEVGATVAESGFFLAQEPIPGLGGAPQVAQTAFTLADGAVSGPLSSPRGPVFVTVTGKQAPYVPKLDEVKERVRQDVVNERATALATERARTLAATLKNAKDFTAAAKAAGTEAKETPLIAREAAIPEVGVSPEVDKVAFALPVGGVSDAIATKTGAVVVRVAERDEVTPEKLAAARSGFRRDLENEQRGQFFASYMSKAKQKMTITVNDEVVKRVLGNQ